MTLDDFYAGRSMPVNEPLMRAFISAGLSEHTGHGIPVIVNSYGRDAFEITGGIIRVTLRFTSRRIATEFRQYNSEPLSELEFPRILLTTP